MDEAAPSSNASSRPYKVARDAGSGPWDVIVIGSGMGGMACAAALAKYGRRVLVLEQHYIPGGFTHMFSRKGYHWDVGVHAMGEMRAEDVPGRLLRWLTNNQVKMQSLGSPYDRFYFPDNFYIEFPDSRKAFTQNLKEKFPEESEAIDQYFKLAGKVAKGSKPFFAGKSLPEWMDRLLTRLTYRSSGEWWKKTTAEVLDQLTDNEKLKAVLTAQWGYYGSPPRESSFALHALTAVHFWNGAYYPVGGSKVFAEELLRVVKDAGGETLVKASVEEILTRRGQAVGVRLADGKEFRAPLVISAAGAKTTFEKLLPEEYRQKAGTQEIVPIPDSPAYVCMNLGFKGDIRAAGAAPSNFWFMETWDINRALWDIDDPESEAPILYTSFPSLKDPLHEPGPEQKHTGECITFVPWKSFEKWAGTSWRNRGEDYEAFKEEICQRVLHQLRRHIPKVLDLLDYYELSTPLTTEHFARAHQGAIYGLEATPTRFTNKKLRTRTAIKNLYLAGGDVTTLGVVGAMTGGLLAAATVEKRVYGKLL